MCGTVAQPAYGLDFGKDDNFIRTKLSKSRSLQDLRDIVLELPSDAARVAKLRRRISSVEDLMVLAGRVEEEKDAAAKLGSAMGLDEIMAEVPVPIRSPRLDKQAAAACEVEPCSDLHCDGSCGVHHASATALPVPELTRNGSSIVVEEAKVVAAPEPRAAQGQPVPNSFTSLFGHATHRPLDAPPQANSPPQSGGSVMGSLKSIPSAMGPASVSPPGSGANSPPLTRGMSPEPAAGRSVLGLDDRRSSCDLGHVAPASGHLGQGSAAVELFYRLNHARQTVDYVKRQATQYAPLNRATMDIWEALELLNSLREYESALLGADPSDADMPLIEHAMQTAEACRLAFPEHDWMALVGLIHGLGKLLAHAQFGGEPQWAVCGESFPVGCRFHPSVVHSQYFQANPDRRRRAYATPTGMYQPNCGLSGVCMSWSGAEYLYMVLARNRIALPAEAMFLIRHQKFAALLRPGQPYGELLSAFDRSMLPMLSKFKELSAYKHQDLPGRLEGQALKDYYNALLEKYIPQGKLRW